MMNRFKKVVLFGGLFMLLAGCGIYAKKQAIKYLPQSKYRSVLVLVFKTDTPGSVLGLAAADSMASSLNQLGFLVVDREYARKVADQKGIGANPTIEQLQALAKDLGIAGVIQGVVSETGEVQTEIPGYVATTNTSFNAWGGARSGDIYAQGATPQTIARFSATAKLTDVNNGAVIWSQALSDSFYNSTVQNVANSVMDRMAVNLAERLKSSRL